MEKELLMSELKIKRLTDLLDREKAKRNEILSKMPEEERIIHDYKITYKSRYSEVYENLVKRGIFKKWYYYNDAQFSQEEIDEFKKDNVFIDRNGYEHNFKVIEFEIGYQRT